MSDEIGTYSFLPWLRHGVANNINSADLDPAVRTRAQIQIDLAITGEPVEGDTNQTETVSRSVELYGPGDIVGLDPKAIVKVEPRDHITNFEPNYLPYIEFYDEDFPWRYTPAAPDTNLHRLRPWLVLVVLTEEEFANATTTSSRPLDAIEVTASTADVFPPADQLWGWAHVHANRDLIDQAGVVTSTDGDAAGERLESALRSNPDHAYSRIISPRRLSANTGYHAFLMPSFESGRLAGLGLDPDDGNAARFATQSAWDDYAGRPVSGLYPYYKRWYFKTGDIGDFEYLVRLLQPRPPDSRLGRRDMDVQTPGSNLTGIQNPALEGVLRLGGALKVPDGALTDAEEDEAQLFEDWDEPTPHPFQTDLAAFINLADDYRTEDDPDPLITPPLYGRWHALTERLLEDEDGNPLSPTDNWVHEANLDPRFRVAAGFGTRVVQDNQEEYMDAAWSQVGDVIEANRRIRLATLAKEASFVWHNKHLGPLRDLSTERVMTMTAPVQRRVIADGLNVRYQVNQSTVPAAALSAPLRRVLRPRDHVATRLGFDRPAGAEILIDKINRGEVSAAPPRVTPEALPTLDEVAEELEPQGPLADLIDALRKNPRLKWLILGVLLLIALVLLFFSPVLALAVAAAAVGAFVYLRRLEQQPDNADAVLPEGNSPEVIDALPELPGFEIRDPQPGAPEFVPGATDSPEAERFKVALIGTHTLISTSAQLGELPQRAPIDIPGLTSATFEAIDPQVTVPAFTLAGITFPARLVAVNFEVFREAMAYPELDMPMYEPLLGLSDEHFLPNIEKIPPNTITLLETNQRFIEAYMLGLNVEFAGELLWREFPTDQRGSYFRQFWDPSGVRNTENLSKEELREKLRDIPPIHTWSRFSSLGDHDHREAEGDNEEEVVLVIRGELLKKYPTAVIYAQKARWQLTDGNIDTSLPREFETEGTVDNIIKTPLYEAKVDPDITFLGFDLTEEEVQGGSGEPGDEDAGWFFVIKERPGEPRFGLDIESSGPLNVWNDLAWPDVYDEDDRFLQVGSGAPTLNLIPPPATAPAAELEQHEEDIALQWHAQTNAAELTYILYQVPVLVGVHGSEMLPS